MKLRTTTPVSTSFTVKSALVLIAIVMVASIFMKMPLVAADSYDDRIEAMKRQVASYQNEANRLRGEADTLQNTLGQLNADKSAIQTQIDANQLRFDQLNEQIDTNEKKIAKSQDILGDTIADLYVDDKITPLEMLASSKNIGDYLDKQEYRSSVRDELTKTIAEIKVLKKDLEVKKADVKKVLDDQNFKRDELASKEAAQQKILDETKGSEDNYKSMINSSNANIQKIQQEQQAAYEAARNQWSGGYISSGGSGGYPYASAPYPCWNASCVDPWGLYYRECVSYVAWKLNATGHGVKGFGGAGNAGDWPSTAAGYTSQTRGVPHVGDAAVIPYGGNFPYGHVMFVESINGDGSINISEYNFAGPGQYSERRIPASSYGGYIFMTFPKR